MRNLPVDDKGYPVALFDKVDPQCWMLVVENALCRICGERLGLRVVFVLDPASAVGRVTDSIPAHYECANWWACHLAGEGCVALWICRHYAIMHDRERRPYIRLQDLDRVEWYAGGRLATRDEVRRAIESGLFNAREERPEAAKDLNRLVQSLLPAR